MNTSLLPHGAGDVKVIIGMVFQNFESFPQFTVVENLTLAQVRALGRSKEEAYRTAHVLLERIGLLAYADKLPRELSSGQQQQVAIASALPEVAVATVCVQAEVGC